MELLLLNQLIISSGQRELLLLVQTRRMFREERAAQRVGEVHKLCVSYFMATLPALARLSGTYESIPKTFEGGGCTRRNLPVNELPQDTEMS